jgi:hypothetical protein
VNEVTSTNQSQTDNQNDLDATELRDDLRRLRVVLEKLEQGLTIKASLLNSDSDRKGGTAQ